MADKILGLSKPQLAIVGVGGAVTIFLVFKHYQNANAANAASTTANTSADIDPATGYPYGSPEDEAALSEQQSDLSGLAASDGGTVSEPTGTTTTTTTTGATTNAAWAQEAQAALVALGYNAESAAGAIGAYLGGIAETPSQVNMIQIVLAEVGPPPVGTYSIISAGSSGGGSTGTTGNPAPISGNPVGPVSTSNYQFPAPQNLTAQSGGSGKINVSWIPVVGPSGQTPSGYTVAYGRTSGAQTWKNTTTATSITLTTIPGETEYIECWANGGPIAPPHAGPIQATAGK
jgi:hypothetical protein